MPQRNVYRIIKKVVRICLLSALFIVAFLYMYGVFRPMVGDYIVRIFK